MTPKEMIEVISAFERGEKIEVTERGFNDWRICCIPLWSFNTHTYRIIPPKPKMVKWYGYGDNGYVRLSTQPDKTCWKRVPNFDCELPE